MWFKSAASAASSVWSVTKSLLGDSRSPAQKLLDDITESEDEIISTNKLNDLSTMTYEIDTFNEIVTLCLQRLKVFRYDLDEARKNLNVLITVNYLIKHGATGFVDELREHVGMFERYQGLKELHTYESADLQEKLNYELQKIKSRASHIKTLLEDKQKLLKQKQLSMLVKQKLKMYEKNRKQAVAISSEGKATSASEDYMSRADSLLQKYLWKYVDKLDDQLDLVSQAIMKNIDKYLLGEMSEDFVIDSAEREEYAGHSQENQLTGNQNIQLIEPLSDSIDGNLLERINDELKEHKSRPEKFDLLEFEEIPDGPSEDEERIKSMENNSLI